jgi:peroxiredoxin (alkyl hydroperoxide reductase subunit C)
MSNVDGFEDEEFFMEPSSVTAKQAPNFKAKAVFGNDEIGEMDFHSYIRGKYAVLFFYPLDFTFVCPSEIIAFDNRIADFKARNCEVIGVSIDSQFSHYAWRNTPVEKGGIGKISYPLVADIKKTIARSYGVLFNEEVAFRGTFIIDDKGVVRSSLINDLPIGRSVDEILRLVDAVQFNAQNGEVCPANWKKGKSGMKANANGVSEYLSKHGSDIK